MYRYYFQLMVLIAMSLGLSSAANAQSDSKNSLPAFPKDWLGNWSGQLHIYNQSGMVQELDIELVLQEIKVDSMYQWSIKYITPDRVDERKYFLLKGNGEANHWVVDEDNGILLDGYVLANRFYLLFDVMDSRIQTSYTLEKDKLIFENLASRVPPVNTSGGIQKDSTEIPTVNSYTVVNLQKAILSKTD